MYTAFLPLHRFLLYKFTGNEKEEPQSEVPLFPCILKCIEMGLHFIQLFLHWLFVPLQTLQFPMVVLEC